LNSVVRHAASLLAASLACAATLAEAGQIYKCSGSDGSVEFSNLSCPPNTTASLYTARPNSAETSESRRSTRLRPKDEGAAGDAGYTGAVWDGYRDESGGSGRTRAVVDAPDGSLDLTRAERMRAAKDAEARRRALRQRNVPARNL